MKKIDRKYFIEVCNRSLSMASAAAELNMHFNTFKKYAVEFGCYNPNQSGLGMKKKSVFRVELDGILKGQHPHFQTYKLKNRLLKEGVLENKCSVCGITDWNGKELNMELDHIDGNRSNHKIKNLRMICPNCHAQTPTYRSKNIQK